MTILEAFEILPKSDKTIVRHRFRIGDLILRNCLGSPCDYLVCEFGKVLGAVRYYRGRKLSCYEIEKI